MSQRSSVGGLRTTSAVSTPLRWEEVDSKLDPAEFTMDVVLRRIKEHGDLYEGVLTTKQSLGAALKALE